MQDLKELMKEDLKLFIIEMEKFAEKQYQRNLDRRRDVFKSVCFDDYQDSLYESIAQGLKVKKLDIKE